MPAALITRGASPPDPPWSGKPSKPQIAPLKTLDVTLDPGHYDVSSLPFQIATKILANRSRTTLPKVESSGHTSNEVQIITADSSLYNDLSLLIGCMQSSAARLRGIGSPWVTAAQFLPSGDQQ